MCSGKKQNKQQQQEQENICLTEVDAIGDYELRSLLIITLTEIMSHPCQYIKKE